MVIPLKKGQNPAYKSSDFFLIFSGNGLILSTKETLARPYTKKFHTQILICIVTSLVLSFLNLYALGQKENVEAKEHKNPWLFLHHLPLS